MVCSLHPLGEMHCPFPPFCSRLFRFEKKEDKRSPLLINSKRRLVSPGRARLGCSISATPRAPAPARTLPYWLVRSGGHNRAGEGGAARRGAGDGMFVIALVLLFLARLGCLLPLAASAPRACPRPLLLRARLVFGPRFRTYPGPAPRARLSAGPLLRLPLMSLSLSSLSLLSISPL